MKIISWNCQDGFISREKYSKLGSLNPDIAVVQECLHPNDFNNKLKYHDVIWQGKSKSKGICVLSFHPDIKLELLEQEVTYEWILPIKVSGKQNFILLAIWVIKQPKQSYGKYLYSVLKEYEHLYKESPIVIIGDFNIDQKLPSSYQGTNGIVQIGDLLSRYKIHSCYHEFYKEDFGKESKPTYFHQRKIEMPFHIDYCFLSNSMINQNTKFYIGDEKEWLKYSDHLPLIVEVKF